MSFPQLNQPTFYITVPSTKERIKFRRFLVAEEKILLMAKESEEPAAIAEAIVDIVQACAIDTIKVETLKPYDLDWMFMQLRAQSVENIAKIKYTDNRDGGEQHTFEINLEAVAMPEAESVKKVVDLDGQTKIEIEYPNIQQMAEITKLVVSDENERSMSDLIKAASIKRVFNDEEEFSADSEQEIFDFIDTFPTKANKEIVDFLNTIPELTHTIEYKDSEGNEQEVVLSGLQDFFTF